MENNRWRTVPIRALCEGIYDGPHATPKKTTYGPIFLGISSLSKGRLDLNSVEHLSENDFIRWTRRVTPRVGDIVFSYETRLGEAALIPDGLRCCLGRRMALMRINPQQADSRFLLYAFLGPEFQALLRERTIHGSTVERIALIEFPSFPISVPGLFEQKAIARILGALDDKIELNRRMNETLEAIARTIFKSWLMESDLTIPQAARTVPFGSIARISRESLNPAEYPTESFDHYSIPAFDQGRLPTVETGDQIKSNKFIVREDSVLLSKLNPRIPRIWMPKLGGVRRAICSTEFLVLQPKGLSSREFLYALCSSQSFLDVFGTMVTGTSGSHQRVKPESLEQMLVGLPSEARLKRYTELIKPLHAKFANNLRESATLANLRDALLPKLISGAIRFKDAQKTVEAHV
jgi:type I restriction enzyme S subunit